LLAFLAYIRFSDTPRPRTYALILVLYVCALLTKINTIVLPAITIAYEVAWRFRLRRRDVLATVPLLAVGAVLAWVNLHGNPSHGVAYHGGSLWTTLRTSSTVVPRYLGLVFAPVDLASYYAVPLRASWLEPAVLASTLAILAVAAAAPLLAWRRHRAGFWIVWFLVTLAPMLNLVPFPALMADRYLYIPLIGPLVLAAWAVAALVVRAPVLARAVPVVVGAAALACALLTIRRIPAFHDDTRLWIDWAVKTSYITADQPYATPPRTEEKRLLRDALAHDESSAPLHNNLGGIAFEENRIADAVAELSRARALDPNDPVIALNLGRAYLFARQFDAAARTLEDAVRLEPPSYYPHLNLARAYLLLGDIARARAAVERAREIRPQWFDLRGVTAAIERTERDQAARTNGS
jgi:tetratricopeptide (TPR) repeat protein